MALDFNNDWIDLRGAGPVIDVVNGASAGTIMGWFRLDVGGNVGLYEYSINNGGAPTPDERLGLDVAAGNFMDSEWAAPDGTLGINTGAWGVPVGGFASHLATMVNVAGDQVKQYLSGALQQTFAQAFVPAAFDATGSASGTIMAEPGGGSGNADGLAEDCRVYSRELTDAMIETIAVCRGHDGIWDSLRGRYPMQEQFPTFNATVAGSVKDWSLFKRDGDPFFGASLVYAESRLSLRRRFT